MSRVPSPRALPAFLNFCALAAVRTRAAVVTRLFEFQLRAKRLPSFERAPPAAEDMRGVPSARSCSTVHRPCFWAVPLDAIRAPALALPCIGPFARSLRALRLRLLIGSATGAGRSARRLALMVRFSKASLHRLRNHCMTCDFVLIRTSVRTDARHGSKGRP